jgi:hypothetical protein
MNPLFQYLYPGNVGFTHVAPHIAVSQHCLDSGQSVLDRQLTGFRQLIRASGLDGVGHPVGFKSKIKNT